MGQDRAGIDDGARRAMTGRTIDAGGPPPPGMPDTPDAPQSWRDVIKIHPAADLFPLMSPEELRVLGDDIKANGMTSPIILWSKGAEQAVVLDGRNRLDAAETAGLDLVSDGHLALSRGNIRWSRLDGKVHPYEYVVSANIHRRHLTAAQRGELIEALLKANPERSDRATAAIAKVDHKTVAAKREALEATGEIPQVEKRTGRDGKARRRSARAAPLPVLSTGEIPQLTDVEDQPPPIQPAPITIADLPIQLAAPLTVAPVGAGPMWLFNTGDSKDVEEAKTRQEVVDSLFRALRAVVDGLFQLPIFLEEAFEKECWSRERIFASGGRQPAISFHDFVHRGYPHGLGSDYATLRRVLVLAAAAQAVIVRPGFPPVPRELLQQCWRLRQGGGAGQPTSKARARPRRRARWHRVQNQGYH